VLSVQFDPLEGLSAGYLGAFWKELGKDWPSPSDAPSVEPVFERFSEKSAWEPAALKFRVSQQIELRLQIFNANKDRMIQVQNDRFFYHWLGTSGNPYPSYKDTRPEFDEYWEKFRTFVLASHSDSDVSIQLNQWEVIYVNHIPKGTVWKDKGKLDELFPFLGNTNLDVENLRMERIGGEWQFEILPQRGRLYVRLSETQKDNEPVLVMTLTARGPIDSEVSIDSGLDLGHELITRAFCTLTSSDAHQQWGGAQCRH